MERERWSLLDWLFPKRCLGCGEMGRYLCEKCLKSVDFQPMQRCAVCNGVAISGKTHERCRSAWGIDGVWAAAGYRGVAKKLLRSFKFGYVRDVEIELVKVLTKVLPEFVKKYDLIVPLPLYESRLRWRGFNQAELLARGLGKYLGTAVDSELLKRVQYKGPQAGVHLRSERLKNVEASVFKLRENVNLKNKSVLLVDDIVTTGSTLRAAAQVLKRARAKEVWGVVVAR